MRETSEIEQLKHKIKLLQAEVASLEAVNRELIDAVNELSSPYVRIERKP